MLVESIKRVRQRLGLTMKVVGERAGLHDEAVARLERPDVDPRASTLARVAKAMGVSVAEFFDEPGHAHEKRHSPRAPSRRRRQTP
jgi:transcriptional regulator with XRE-family HTH domain